MSFEDVTFQPFHDFVEHNVIFRNETRSMVQCFEEAIFSPREGTLTLRVPDADGSEGPRIAALGALTEAIASSRPAPG